MDEQEVAARVNSGFPIPWKSLPTIGRVHTPASCLVTENTRRDIAAQQLLMNPPEFLPRVIEVILRRLDRLGGRGGGNPSAADRLNHRERLQRVRGIPQALVGSMKLLALFFREFCWLAAYLHVAPSELPVAVGAATVTQRHRWSTETSRARSAEDQFVQPGW